MAFVTPSYDLTAYQNLDSTYLCQNERLIEIKTQINKWNLIKFKHLCTAKETTPNRKTSGSIIKQANNPIKKWTEDLKEHFSKEGIQMAKTCKDAQHD